MKCRRMMFPANIWIKSKYRLSVMLLDLPLTAELRPTGDCESANGASMTIESTTVPILITVFIFPLQN
jgi:hypothetical protein